TNLWFVGTPNKSEQAEMVIVDSEGDQIHAICKADQLKSWKADLKENSTYVMHNFKAVKNDGQFRVCEHQYKILDLGVEVSPVLAPGDQESSQLSGASQLSSKDAFLSKAEAKTISEINAISEVVQLFVFIMYSLQ
ncbi:hypothetical protein GYH30_042764, partial [Glycine max]